MSQAFLHGQQMAAGVRELIRKLSSEEEIVAWLRANSALWAIDIAIKMYRSAQIKRVMIQRMRHKPTPKVLNKPSIVARIRQRQANQKIVLSRA